MAECKWPDCDAERTDFRYCDHHRAMSAAPTRHLTRSQDKYTGFYVAKRDGTLIQAYAEEEPESELPW